MQLEAHCILFHIRLKIKFFTHWNPNWFEKYMPNCQSYPAVNLFLFCSILITQLLSISLKSELQFLTVSEYWKLYTLALNFKDWPFDAIVTRHFRPKSGHLNERVYCKPIDGTLKMLFIKRLGSFLPELWKLLVFGLTKRKAPVLFVLLCLLSKIILLKLLLRF